MIKIDESHNPSAKSKSFPASGTIKFNPLSKKDTSIQGRGGSSPTSKRSVDFNKLTDLMEDLEDSVEFINELFEQC